MSQITSDQALAVLTGSEGAPNNTVQQLAVPDKYLGQAGHGYASGFAFGKVQLDIGNNAEAQSAYKEILALGVSSGQLTQAQSDDLDKYAVKRPDVAFPDSYKQARDTLNSTVFNPDSPIASQVNSIIATHQKNDLENRTVKKVNDFLQDHTTGVFDPTSKDYSTAVAAVVSAVNRSGSADRFSAALDGNKAPTLDDAKAAWKQQIGSGVQSNDWALVEKGAKNLDAQASQQTKAADAPAQPAPGAAAQPGTAQQGDVQAVQNGNNNASTLTAETAAALPVNASRKETTDHMLAAILSYDPAIMHAGITAGLNTHASQQALQQANDMAAQVAPANPAQNQPAPQQVQSPVVRR